MEQASAWHCWHGSLGCHTWDPGGNFTFQCNTLHAKTKKKHLSRQQGKANTTNRQFRTTKNHGQTTLEGKTVTVSPFWCNQRSLNSLCRAIATVEALTAANRGALLMLKTLKNLDVFSNAVAPMPLAPNLQKTRRARMTRRPSVAECQYETTCLRHNIPTEPQSIPRHNTTQCKTVQVELQHTSTDISPPETNKRNQKPLLQNSQKRTNRNTTETMEGPETTTITPFARDKHHI